MGNVFLGMEKLAVCIVFFIRFCATLNAQIIDDSGYLLGNFVEIGINPNGHEGALSIEGDHARYEPDSLSLGIVANPQMDGWIEYNGDYFMPGTPQNSFGLEIAGSNYANGMAISDEIPGAIIGYWDEDNCLMLEWEGEIEGVILNIKYQLLKDALFYTTEITLTNTNPISLTNVYYFRTIEPDNNQPLNDNYSTTNTIVSQPGLDCKKALVTAEQASPWDSYIGFCAIGGNFRCSRGGFVVSNASNIYDGIGGQVGTVGSSLTADQAISLAYKIGVLSPGSTRRFKFATVLSEDAVADAISNLYRINYDIGEGTGTADCNNFIDTLRIDCEDGNTVTLSIDGPDVDSYDWSWSPETYLSDTAGESVESTPADTIIYTVIGTPIADCLESEIIKSIVVIPTGGVRPNIFVVDPGIQCDEFDITTLEFYDENDIPLTVSYFFTEIPDSADQTTPLFEEDFITATDEIYLMIADTASNCFAWTEIIIDYSYSVYAGSDSLISTCTNSDHLINIFDLIADGISLDGVLSENTASGQFNELTGEFEPTGLEGVYTFNYVLVAEEPCVNDTSLYTIIVNPIPEVNFPDLEDELICLDFGLITLFAEPEDGTFSGSGVTGSNFDPVLAGEGTHILYYTFEDDNSCSATDSIQVIIADCLGMDEKNENQITLYPNPFNGFTTINFGRELTEYYSIFIYDILGQLVYQNENISGSSVKIESKNLVSGSYVLSVLDSNSENVFSTKLMIE